MNPLEEHTVTFLSAGTLMAETTTRPIALWDTTTACAMAKEIVERHGARPFAFFFRTEAVAPDSPDGVGGVIKGGRKLTRRSGCYFINGKVETLAEVESRTDPSESILLENMRCNGYTRVCTVVNGYRSTLPFESGDVNLDPDGKLIEVCP